MDGGAFFEFEDILQFRREQYDLAFMVKPYLVDQPGTATSSSSDTREPSGPRPSPNDVKQRILKSAALEHAIRAIRVETGESEDQLRKDATSIINRMAHDQNLPWARFAATLLSHFWKQIYSGIHVNFAGLEKIRPLFGKAPVVFLPSHRSYMDFLLLSFILYCYDVPVPVIAAAEDFLGMGMVGELLRKCGAFFIKRSFKSDKLYWTIFSEYVQAHLHYAKFPVEFFIEGTRSRSGNFLYPKTGMMNVICQDYFKGRVKDIYFVPVSISYERVLEEKLYAYEFATGQPKPRESMSGLLKARSVLLNENYGNIYVNFGESFSLREMSKGRVDRSVFALRPMFEEFTSPESDRFVLELSLYTIAQIQKNIVVQPWHLVASGLLNRAAPTASRSVTSQELLAYVNILSELLRVSNVKQLLTQFNNTDILAATTIHPSTVSFCSFTKQFLLTADDMSDAAITPVQLLIYQNMFLNQIAHLAFLVTVLDHRSMTKSEATSAWAEVVQLFMYEIVSVNINIDESFDQLMSLNIISSSQNSLSSENIVFHVNRSSPSLRVLLEILWPYTLVMACSIDYVCKQGVILDSSKRLDYFSPAIMTSLKRLYDAGRLSGPQCVSKSMVNNALYSFKNLRVFRDAGKSQYTIDVPKAVEIRSKLHRLFRLPSAFTALSSHL